MVTSSEAPVIAGPLVGAKVYRATGNGLRPLWHEGTVGRTQQARCLASPRRHDPEEAPRLGCLCGIYVYRGTRAADDWYELVCDASIVWAVVTLWGRVIEHRGGWRAEHVRIEQLVCSPTAEWIVGLLAESWQVPLLVVPSHQDPWRGYQAHWRRIADLVEELRLSPLHLLPSPSHLS